MLPKFVVQNAVRVTGIIDTTKFEDLVGMLKSEVMEAADDKMTNSAGIAFKADE